MRRKHLFLICFILVLALALLMAGCGKKGKGKKAQPPEPQPGPEPKVIPSPKITPTPSSVDFPQAFKTMLAAPAKRTFYIAKSVKGASDDNDCLAQTNEGNNRGPCASMGVVKGLSLQAGDTVMIGEGTYDIGSKGLGLKFSGTEKEPVRITSFPGERPVFDLTKIVDKKEVLIIGGKYVIFESIELSCPDNPPVPRHLQCVTIFDKNIADHIIIHDVIFRNALEDGIKTTTESQNLLIYRNEFVGTHGQGESIDVFGADHVWIVENEFHATNLNIREPGVEMWAKGGAYDVWFVGNYFHDLTVYPYALILGGCCWNNWDSRNSDGSPKYVAEEVHAIDNVFENIDIEGDYLYQAALGVEGCKNCEYRGNIVKNVDVGIGIRPTQSGSDKRTPSDILIEDNVFVNVRTGIVLALHHDVLRGITLQKNSFYLDGDAMGKIGKQEKSFGELKSLGYGSIGDVFPLGSYSGA